METFEDIRTTRVTSGPRGQLDTGVDVKRFIINVCLSFSLSLVAKHPMITDGEAHRPLKLHTAQADIYLGLRALDFFLRETSNRLPRDRVGATMAPPCRRLQELKPSE